MIDTRLKPFYFIAVNYNGSYFTIKYIESIERLIQINLNLRIIIVDNASEMGDFIKIENYAKNKHNVKLIKNKENLGYFKALNVGISTIQDKRGIYIIGNNDLEFDKNFLIEINNIEYGDDILVIAPNVITRDGYHQNPHCLKRISTFRKAGYKIYFLNYHLGQCIYWIMQKYKKIKCVQQKYLWDRRQIVYMGIGACYILTENFFKFYNLIDDRIFLWGEEAMLAGQVSAVGGKILYDPNVIVHHYESGIVRSIPTRHVYRITKQSYKIYSRYL